MRDLHGWTHPDRSRPAALARRLAPVTLILTLALTGCTSADKSQPDKAADAAQEPATDVDSAATHLQNLYDTLGPNASKARTDRSGSNPNRNAARVFPAPIDNSPSDPSSEIAGPPAPSHDAQLAAANTQLEPKPKPAETADQRRDRLVSELLDTYSPKPGETPSLETALAIAALQTLRPGSGEAAMREARARLNPSQQAVFDALRDLLARTGNTGDTDASTDPAQLARLLQSQAAALMAQQGLTIPRTALARRVDGFGRFTPFPSSTFLAGRSQTALVYVEVENFTHKALGGPEGDAAEGPEPSGESQWVVELSQELQLFHDSDGVLAWHARETVSRDVSRNRRHDYYLVQRIELPSTLTVGAYKLKVVIRDKANASQAESVIPLQIVADPALAQVSGH